MILARNSITLSHVRDIISTTWYYRLQTSTASPPSKPDTETPAGWTTVEPSYTSGSTSSLYVTMQTLYSDGSFDYSDVSLSSSFEAAKEAYNKAAATQEAFEDYINPIAAGVYTDLIGTANNAAGASFYFAKIHPDDYDGIWKVQMKIYVSVPSYPAYSETIDITLSGCQSAFNSYDAYVTRGGSIGMYFVNLYRATANGIRVNHAGHALGFGLRASTNPTDSTYKRNISVAVTELEGCLIEMLDTAVLYADMEGTGSANYSGLTELGVSANGQNATNNSNTSYTQFANAVKAGANGVRPYSLVMKDTTDTWVSLYSSAANGTAAGKTKYAGGLRTDALMYSAGSGNYTEGANTLTIYSAYPFDLRYSTNCASTLTANKSVYLVGEIKDDGLFYLDDVWYTQTAPVSEDGKTYIYVGEAYSSYQVWLSAEHPVMQYADGKFRNAADIAAAKAMASADGKNRNIYQASAPAGTDWNVGDTWFNTANGNAIKRWSGSAWVDAKLSDKALDVLTVAKAIISYLDVGSLSAGDITALLAVFKKISSKDGKNYWNLETGLFHTEKGEFTGSVTGSTITGSSLQTTNGTTATFDYSTSNGGISNRGASSSADSHVTVSARGVKHYHSDDDSDAAAIKAQVIPALMNGTEYGWYITPMAYIRKLFTDNGQVVCKPELNSVISSLNTTIGQINTRVGALLASSTPATGVSGVSGNVCGQTAMLYFSNFSFTVSGSGSTAAVSTGQLNAAYYPARTLDLVDTLNGVRFTISTSGEIKVSGSLSATKAIRGTFTYIRANVSLGTNASTLTPVSYEY